MAYCPECGEQVDAGARFCEHCGKQLKSDEGSGVRADTGSPGSAEKVAEDPILKNYKPVEPPPDLPFKLQDGEVILKAFRPNSRIIAKSAVGGIITSVILILAFWLPLDLVLGSAPVQQHPTLTVITLFVVIVVVVILLSTILTGFLAYRKYAYWITNRRTIGRRGVVGYSTDSMPLDNIADVVVMRTIMDRLLGISSLYIQPYGGAGFMMPARNAGVNRFSGSNSFLGIMPSEAPEIQQLIFHLRDASKKASVR